MTITQSLRDNNARSNSIADAIDGLAVAMGGGSSSRSTRTNTDGTGRIVEQTSYTSSGKAVSVKRSERNTGGGKSPNGETIVYDGNFWIINNVNGPDTLKIDIVCEDFEKVVIKISAVGAEATVSDNIRIINTTSGGMVNYSIMTSTDFVFIGFPGESYTLEFLCGGGVGSSNGTLTIDYMPELAQALSGDPFSGAWGASSIPTYFGDYVPKLLPSAVITRSGGPAVFTTAFSFRFNAGLRPWFPYPTDYLHRVAIVIKYVGVDIGSSLGVSDIAISAMEYDGLPGVGTAVSLTGQWCGMVPGGLWPSMIGYCEFVQDVSNGAPCAINITVTHGAGAYFPDVPTLGYFIAEGRD